MEGKLEYRAVHAHNASPEIVYLNGLIDCCEFNIFHIFLTDVSAANTKHACVSVRMRILRVCISIISSPLSLHILTPRPSPSVSVLEVPGERANTRL